MLINGRKKDNVDMNLGLNYIKVIECSEVKRIKWIYQNEKETSNSEISIN